MKLIPLTRGMSAIVDDEDFELLSKLKWCATEQGYAVRGQYEPATQKTKIQYMHRVIARTPTGFDTDHINENKLDNRKENLRTASRSHNLINQRKARSDSRVGVRGVQMTKGGRFYSGVKANGRHIHLGMFSTAAEASAAYERAKKELWGEFAPA